MIAPNCWLALSLAIRMEAGLDAHTADEDNIPSEWWWEPWWAWSGYLASAVLRVPNACARGATLRYRIKATAS